MVLPVNFPVMDSMNWKFRGFNLRSRWEKVAPGATGGLVGCSSQPAQQVAESA